jgi:iron complex transport system substrate-binding protein
MYALEMHPRTFTMINYNKLIRCVLIAYISCFCVSVCFSQILTQKNKNKSDKIKRIVSLAPSLTESIYLLEMGPYLVGNTIYCNKPDDAKTKKRVASVVDVNIEEVVRLNPDLIVATHLTDHRAIKKFKLLGIDICSFAQPYNFNQMAKQLIDLGQKLGQKELAEKLVARAQNRINLLTSQLNPGRTQKVFVQLGARPLYAATNESFVNDLVTLAKGINIAANQKNGIYSKEQVLAENPDIILITSMGMTGDDERKRWLRFDSLKAAKSRRVHIIDSELFCSPTVVSFADALQQLIHLLHPQLDRNNIHESKSH